MFKKKLLENYAKPAITTSRGITYTSGMLLRKIYAFVQLFEVLRVDRNDVVGIHCKNEATTISAMIACMSYGTNFTVLNYSDDIIVTRLKASFSKASTGLILSEDIIEAYAFIINPETFEIVQKNINFYNLEDRFKISSGNLYDALKHINTTAMSRGRGTNYLTDFDVIPEAYLTEVSMKLMGVAYHSGIEKGIINASVIPLRGIYKGIKRGLKHLDYAKTSKILCLEPANLLYDIVNGIIIPILAGGHVLMADSSSFNTLINSIKNTKAKVLYTDTNKLEVLLGALEREITPLKWIKKIKVIYNFAMTRKFNKLFKSEIGHVVLHGRISNRNLFNSISKKYTVLYTMNEVTSFVAYNTFKKLPKEITLKAVDIRDMAINGKDENVIGEVMVYTPDMMDRYLTQSHTREKLLEHSCRGRLRTGDAGYIKNGELIIVDKAKNIFFNEHGLKIETGKIITLALRSNLVKEANVFRGEDNLLKLLIEPDFSYASNKGMEVQDIKQEIYSLKHLINKHLKKYSQIDETVIFSDPKGLQRKNFKIISRHF